MRLLLVASICVLLAVLASGQDPNRRERLRNLISAARSGDREARKTLRNLRNKLKDRAISQKASIPADPIPQPSIIDAQPEPQIQEVVVEQPRSIQPQPSRRERVRPQFEPRTSEFPQPILEPHRSLNRGLEIDNRSEANANIRVTNRTKTPPVETIRRYSYFDEQGNYIFGYEASDGSFKEEKRGMDCIVHGKYGYVDPDGVRREFTYVSGNKCDPNAPADPELQADQPNIPPNDQFLIQTQEQQLNEATLQKLSLNRRRKPVEQQQTRQQQPRQQQPRQQQQSRPQRVKSRRRQEQRIQTEERQNTITIQENNIHQQRPQDQNQVAATPDPLKSTFPPFRPKPAKSTFPPFRPETSQTTRPSFRLEPTTTLPPFRPPQQRLPEPNPVIFRPTPKPVDVNFNFEQEFHNIFSNFAHSRPLPTPRQRLPQILPAPTQAPPKPQPPVIKQDPKPVTIQEAKPAPAFPPKHSAPAKPPHQLVFDAATGTFKTVPLQNLITVDQTPRRPPPPPPSPSPPQPINPNEGRPLQIPGFNPLPPVPLGSLTFSSAHGSRSNFNNFFNNFNV